MAKTSTVQLPDTQTRYVKQVHNGWEYGYYVRGTAFKEGLVPTREQALEINAMRLESASDNRPRYRR